MRISDLSSDVCSSDLVTNDRGEWLDNGFGGKVDVTLIPHEGSGYLPVETSVDLQADNHLIEMTLFMEQGTRIYGTVSSWEERRVGKEWVRKCRDRGSTYM